MMAAAVYSTSPTSSITHQKSHHPPPTTTTRAASSSTSVLTTLLVQLGQGHDPELEEELEQEEQEEASPISIEEWPTTSFDAKAYQAHAAEYYAQPLLLTGQDSSIACWPKLPRRPCKEKEERDDHDDASRRRKLFTNALASCRVCRITIPPLLKPQKEGGGNNQERQRRLVTLQEGDIQVENINNDENTDAALNLLMLQDRGEEEEEEESLAGNVRTMVYAYGPLDVSPLHHHQQEQSSPSSSSCFFWSSFPPSACLQGDGTRIVAANLWVGQNLTSRLHVDGLDNLLCVSQGSKVVHLYSPWQLAELDPHPPGTRPPPVESQWQSRLFHSPQDWPPGLHAHAVAHVQAGECLFIPAGWFHEVFTPTTSNTVAVSFWCESKSEEVASRIRLRPSLLHLAAGGAAGGGGGGLSPYQAFLEEQQQRKKRCTRHEEEESEKNDQGT